MAKLIYEGDAGWFLEIGDKKYPLGYPDIPKKYDGAKVKPK